MEPAPPKLYSFWLSENKMSDRRKQSVEMLQDMGLDFHLITEENLSEYIKGPIHEAYNYLSVCHKSDYLRCHFMHFFGGAYADIKPPTGKWLKSLEQLNSSDKWASAFIHHAVEALGNHIIFPEHCGHQIGDQGFIFKPNTSFTKEWYERVVSTMDKNLDQLKSVTTPLDKYGNQTGYPIRIGELLLEILHPLTKKYKQKFLMNLPPLNCDIYL